MGQFATQLGLMLPAAYLVLVKGVHLEARAKIEVLSNRTEETLCEMDGNLLAFVTPTPRQTAVPAFAPSEIKPLADLIEREILGKPGFSNVTKNSNFGNPSVLPFPVV